MNFPTFDDLLDIDYTDSKWYELTDLPNEQWKDIQNYKGIYQVSNYGRVKSLGRTLERETRWGNISSFTISEKIKKIAKNNKGYNTVNLCKNCKSKHYLLHRLVAQAFIPNPKQYNEIDHINENKDDNKINNLMWCSRQYNNTKGIQSREGRRKTSKHRMKSVKQYDMNNNLIKIFEGVRIAEEETNIDNTAIIRCCKGMCKSAGGYRWRYHNE